MALTFCISNSFFFFFLIFSNVVPLEIDRCLNFFQRSERMLLLHFPLFVPLHTYVYHKKGAMLCFGIVVFPG